MSASTLFEIHVIFIKSKPMFPIAHAVSYVIALFRFVCCFGSSMFSSFFSMHANLLIVFLNMPQCFMRLSLEVWKLPKKVHKLQCLFNVDLVYLFSPIAVISFVHSSTCFVRPQRVWMFANLVCRLRRSSFRMTEMARKTEIRINVVLR